MTKTKINEGFKNYISTLLSTGLFAAVLVFSFMPLNNLSAQANQFTSQKEIGDLRADSHVIPLVDSALDTEMRILTDLAANSKDYKNKLYGQLANGYESVRENLRIAQQNSQNIELRSLISGAFSNVLSEFPDKSPNVVHDAKTIIMSMDNWRLSESDISDFENTLLSIREFINQ